MTPGETHGLGTRAVLQSNSRTPELPNSRTPETQLHSPQRKMRSIPAQFCTTKRQVPTQFKIA